MSPFQSLQSIRQGLEDVFVVLLLVLTTTTAIGLIYWIIMIEESGPVQIGDCDSIRIKVGPLKDFD